MGRGFPFRLDPSSEGVCFGVDPVGICVTLSCLYSMVSYQIFMDI